MSWLIRDLRVSTAEHQLADWKMIRLPVYSMFTMRKQSARTPSRSTKFNNQDIGALQPLFYPLYRVGQKRIFQYTISMQLFLT